MTTHEIFLKLKRKAYPSGSRVYGGFKSTSDYDYLISQTDFHFICGYENDIPVKIHQISDPTYNEDVGFILYQYSFNQKRYHFIVFHNDLIFEDYKRATDCMCDIPPMNDKDIRIAMFHFFCNHKVEGY